MRIPWIFYDPVTFESYAWPVNPRTGAAPSYRKNVTKKATTGAGGAVLIFEGADQPQSFNFSGTILTEAQYNVMIEWWEKRRIITITDDLGRDWNVYFESFEPTREPRMSHPWRHTYSAECTVVR